MDVQMHDDFGEDNEGSIQTTEPNPNGFFADTGDSKACSVRVALRVRPLIGKELRERASICIQTREDENNVIIGQDRQFTYDKCFGMDSRQDVVFDTCVKNLVLGCFLGFNATILAYGQTGSGKTFTMGSGYIVGVKEDDLGIIPRVIRLIFDEVEARKNKAEFIIKCSFLEIYNEELHDLLDSGMGNSTMIDRIMPTKKEINIREEKNGTISVYGLKEITVKSQEEMARQLDIGSGNRSVASTLMNNQSSRSHGIFTITIEQHLIEDLITGVPAQGSSNQEKPDEYMVAKFHFVDLAGSERAKKTGAVGDVLKEGISINKGLLALGNVISSLTEEGKNKHVPYRDSKLTRILQDSLGGNSRTVMVACCSPAETNYEETLNTLKYASRARNIKNKPIVNRDPASQQIAQLRQQVYELQKELLNFRKLLLTNNIEFDMSVDLPTEGALSTMGQSIAQTNKAMGLTQMGSGSGITGAEVKRLEQQISELKAKVSNREKESKSNFAKYEQVNDVYQKLQIDHFDLQKERDQSRFKLEAIIQILKNKGIFEDIVKEINGGVMPEQIDGEDAQIFDTVFGNSGPTILEEYQLKVEEQTKELSEMSLQLKQLQIDNQQLIEQASQDLKSLEQKSTEIEKLKRQATNLQREKEKILMESKKSQPAKSTAFPPLNTTRNPDFSKTSMRRSTTVMNSTFNKPKPSEDPNQWMTTELDNKLKTFVQTTNYIEQLTKTIFNPMQARQSVKIPSTQPLLDVSGVGADTSQDNSSGLLVINKGEDQEMVADEPEQNNQMGSEHDDSDNKTDDDKDLLDVIEEMENGNQQDHNDLQMQENINRQTTQVQELDNVVRDKEQLLEDIKTSTKEIQGNLLMAMKEQYHMKIQAMQEEMNRLEQEKEESLRKSTGNAQKSKIEDMFKQKSNELKVKLKELEEKQREQQRMQRNLNQKENQVKSLSTEIDKMKTQKVTLMKKIKEESDNYAKLKKQRAQEVAKYKKQLLKTQKENDALKREAKKKDIFMKRKQEEINLMQKKARLDEEKKRNAQKTRQQSQQVNVDKISEWIMANTEKMVNFHFLVEEQQQQEQECFEIENIIDDEQKTLGRLSVQLEKLIQRKSMLELAEDGTQDDEKFETDKQMSDIQSNMGQIKEYIESLEDKQKFISDKISMKSKELIQNQPGSVDSMIFADFQTLEGARTCIGIFFQLLLDINIQYRSLSNELLEYKSQFEALINEMDEINMKMKQDEQRMEFEKENIHNEYCEKERKLVQLILQKTGMDFDLDLEGSLHEQVNLLELIDIMIKQIKASNEGQYEAGIATSHEIGLIQNSKSEGLKKALVAKVGERQEKKEQYNATKAALSKRNVELEKSILEKDMTIRKLKQELQFSNTDRAKYKRFYDEEKKKMKEDANQPAQNQAAMATNMVNNYKDARNKRKMAKQQVASTQGVLSNLLPTNQSLSDNAQGDKQSSFDPEVNDRIHHPPQAENVFERLAPKSRLYRRGNTQSISSPRLGRGESASLNQSEYRDKEKWEMVSDIQDAHKSQIYCLASVGNQIYSTANRSMKIWDIETMKIASDLPDKIGLVKATAFWKERNLLLLAAEKAITMWDVISLTNVGAFKGFKEEIKALHIVPEKELLFAACKGSSQNGGLLIYDFRKIQFPIYEKEKGQDVFSLIGKGDQVYYGCRNHSVYTFCMKTFTTVNALQPPHFDAVTSLALLNGGTSLVSGSRDKNLRLYDLTNPIPDQIDNVLNAHNDHINTLETDPSMSRLYSGSRDGVVKVWASNQSSQNQSGLINYATLEGNAQHQPVNTLCSLNIDPSLGRAFACGSGDKSIRIYRCSNQVTHHVDNEEMKDEMFNPMDEEEQKFYTDHQREQLQELNMIQQKNQTGFKHSHSAVIEESHDMLVNQQKSAQVEQPSTMGGALGQLRMRKQQKQLQQAASMAVDHTNQTYQNM